MCGIAGILSLDGSPVPRLEAALAVLDQLIEHRGPDGSGSWISPGRRCGLAHRRLAIIDLSEAARQPMLAPGPVAITYNGEIYNYRELMTALPDWRFRSSSDTECILAAYDRYGLGCLDHLRGMFAFALWDEREQRLFCGRDRFGIKPFYYTIMDNLLVFASEAKALLPFLPEIATDAGALTEYLTFQYTIGDETLFRGIKQLPPGHALAVENGKLRIWRYWDVRYEIDYDHSAGYFERRLTELLEDSVAVHLRSDVPVGAYVSGGLDSSLIAMLAGRTERGLRDCFHGRFTEFPGYDESDFAAAAVAQLDGRLHVADIVARDFRDRIGDVLYHLDFPVAGPGSFPQFMVSELASRHLKVVLGGQGGDEIFGGYARYLLAYFEQCIKAALDGTYRNGNFVVTIESIVPNLGLLREYKPLITEFWRHGLFGSLDERYFRLIDRSSDMENEVDWSLFDRKRVFENFLAIFNNPANVTKEAYFDKMTHFDFKCLLPALLHVEDRMSMAHGLESRVPLLDHRLIEFLATVPADVKFEGGRMKHLLKLAYGRDLPQAIVNRRDKMGFPVPLKEWFAGELRDFVQDIFRSRSARERPYLNPEAVLANLGAAGQFSRKIWGLLSLELWQQTFHDRAAHYRELLTGAAADAPVLRRAAS
ncbi:MAG: asparagine synthase (glutamine-hydrolyzing) [Alphaproteobacteria bacterium]|nr:asparagine synthase (glutamine-hydrolyzing) [Alphaproteobacteria bacterium]MBV9860852.1 asparagine synthase (glutamine-hydrolyzing) [Alphaproteobacteria bacterium]